MSCKSLYIVVKNLRIVANRSSWTELNYPDSSEGADKDENYSKIDMSGLMCRQQYLSAGRRNIQFHLHIFQNILSRPFCAIFSPALRNCFHLAFCKTQITFRKWVPKQDIFYARTKQYICWRFGLWAGFMMSGLNSMEMELVLERRLELVWGISPPGIATDHSLFVNENKLYLGDSSKKRGYFTVRLTVSVDPPPLYGQFFCDFFWCSFDLLLWLYVFWNGFYTRKKKFSSNYKYPHFFLFTCCCSLLCHKMVG